MSIFQLLGINKCPPVHTVHTLPNLFNRQTKLTAALQSYADSYVLSEIDEHWFLLRDRYTGYDWVKTGLLKEFEDHANQIGGRISGLEYSLAIAKTGSALTETIKFWRDATLNEFRNYELRKDWPELQLDTRYSYGGCLVEAGYFEVAVQFKFLSLVGFVKDPKAKKYLVDLGLRHGR